MITILLLGGYGFIGTNILKYIDNHLLNKYQVIVFDRNTHHPDNENFECVKKVYTGDFSDRYVIDKIFCENKIDIVIHSLSASVPSLSIDNSYDIQSNVIPTISLLEVMSQRKVDKILFISSGGAVYGDSYISKEGHCEEEVLFPKSAYGISKLIIEKYLYLYNIQYGLKSLILRLSNPYGPYHYSKKQGVINIALESALKATDFQVWGDGNGCKDYIYIEDFCSILFQLLEQDWQFYRVLNIGSGELLSVNQILHHIQAYYPTFHWVYKTSNLLDVSDFKLDLHKLHKMITVKYTPIEDGLRKTKQWYEENMRKIM